MFCLSSCNILGPTNVGLNIVSTVASIVGLLPTEPQRKLMAYVIDLTYIMYILSVLEQPTITRRLIKAIYAMYHDSPLKVHVHSKIREYDGNKNPVLE